MFEFLYFLDLKELPTLLKQKDEKRTNLGPVP
jgi:hypothetical protein